MTNPPTYRLWRISRRRSGRGVTDPARCTLEGILKFDSEEAPYCVYNEYVAAGLAKVLQIPVADGILTMTGDGFSFASLALYSPGLSLPDLDERLRDKAAATYPDEVAAMIAFDVLIGNWDRAANVKAALTSRHIRLFQGFDHSHCLLGAKKTEAESIRALREGDLIVTSHPFYGLADDGRVTKWVERIGDLSPDYIKGCVMLGRPFRAVTEATQAKLAQALIKRRNKLPELLEDNPRLAGRLV